MSDQETITGEIECQASGSTLEELLNTAAEQIFSAAVDLESVREREETSFYLPWEGTSEDVFTDFLGECLRCLREEKFLARSCEAEIDSDEINVTLRGATYDPSKHSIITDLKGITDDSIRLNEDMHGTFEAEFSIDA